MADRELTIGPETRPLWKQQREAETAVASMNPLQYLWDALFGSPASRAAEQQKRAAAVAPSQFPQVEMTPEERNQIIANAVLNFVPMGQVKAYHGSARRGWHQPTPESVGLGEGAQARGWGYYITEAEKIGDYYRDMLGGEAYPSIDVLQKYFKPGNVVSGYGGRDLVLDFMPPGHDPRVPHRWLAKVIAVDEKGQVIPGERPRYHATTPQTKEIKQLVPDYVPEPSGETKRLTIHAGKQPSEYTFLAWNEEIPDRTFKGIVRQLEAEKVPMYSGFQSDIANKQSVWTGERLYHELESTLGSDRAASEFLSRAGITGMKYPAGEIGGAATKYGKPAYNYVIYDFNAISPGHAPDLPAASTIATSAGRASDPHRIAQSLGIDYIGSTKVGSKTYHQWNMPAAQGGTTFATKDLSLDAVKAKMAETAKNWAPQPKVYISRNDIEQIKSWGETYNVHRGTREILKGRIFSPEEIPDKLYHVTTDAPAVEKEGVLRSFHEVQNMPGLGKGTSAAHQGVSLTTDKPTAEMIHRELLRRGEIARHEIIDFETTLHTWAREDEKIAGLAPGTLDPAVKESLWWLGKQHEFYPGQNIMKSPSYQRDAMNQYYNRRESLKGQENPIFFGDITSYKTVTPATTKILAIDKAKIPRDALVREPGIGLKEIMVHSEVPIR